MTFSCQYSSHSSSGTSSKRAMPCRADVVHEDVEPAERGDGFGDDALGLAVPRQVRDDVRGLADPRCVASATGDDERLLP